MALSNWPAGAKAAGIVGSLIIVIALIAFLVSIFEPVLFYGIVSAVTVASDGQIIVNSPGVYTRQRLVNDRLSQVSWLQDQLRVTSAPDPDFRSIDEVRSISSSTKVGVRASVGPGTPPANPGNNPPSDTPPSGSPAGGSAPPDSGGQSPAAAGAASIQPTSTDLFRAKNTYREELRAEIMETQLDDRHDIDGNTIYRLSFDATVLPGTKSDALAVIRVELTHDRGTGNKGDPAAGQIYREYSQLYEDWLRYMQKFTADSVEAIATQLANRAADQRIKLTLPNFLLRRICQLTEMRFDYDKYSTVCVPPGTEPTAQLASDEITRTAKRIRDYTSAYLGFRKEIFQKSALPSINKAIQRENQRRESQGKKSLDFQIPDNFFAQPCIPTIPVPILMVKDVKSDEQIQIDCPRTDPPLEGVIAAIKLYSELQSNKPKSPDEADNFVTNLKTKFSCSKDNDISTCVLPDVTEAELRCLAADYMWANLNQFDLPNGPSAMHWYYSGPSQLRFDRYAKIQIIGRELGSCGLLFGTRDQAKDANDPVINLKEDLNKDIELYSYSISPKNLAQRLSTASDTRDAVEAILNAKIEAGGQDISSLVENLRKKSIQSQAIQVNPIVVGYGVAPRPATGDYPSTEFGWIIAPQIRFGTDERTQVDQQYSLAAVISVPSWWRSVNLAIKTCWVRRAVLHFQRQFDECGEQKNPTPHTVRLPGAIQELSRKLGFDVIQEPRLSKTNAPEAPISIEVLRPANVLLAGLRLWRSTEVTLGGQKADEIVVLPNMEGIIAKFRCVRRPPRLPGLPSSTNTSPPAQTAVRPASASPPNSASQPANPAPGSADAAPPANAAPSPLPVEIKVWTSEGATDSIYATLVDPQDSGGGANGLCPDEQRELNALAGGARAPPSAGQPGVSR